MVPLAAGPPEGPAGGVGATGGETTLLELLDDIWGMATAPTAKNMVLENFMVSFSDCVVLYVQV